MFTYMSEFPTHDQQQGTYDDHQGTTSPAHEPEPRQPAAKPARVSAAKVPSDMDTRAARAFARRVLSTREVLSELGSGDVAILERVSGERKATKGSLDELTVVLATSGGGSGGGKDVLTATRDLLAKVSGNPMEAVVEATMLAADSPEVFREVFSLLRELGVHDAARTPSGHEVKAASVLVQSAQQADTGTALARLERLTELLA